MKMTGKRSKNLIAFLFQDQNFKIDKLKAKAKQKKKKRMTKKILINKYAISYLPKGKLETNWGK